MNFHKDDSRPIWYPHLLHALPQDSANRMAMESGIGPSRIVPVSERRGVPTLLLGTSIWIAGIGVSVAYIGISNRVGRGVYPENAIGPLVLALVLLIFSDCLAGLWKFLRRSRQLELTYAGVGGNILPTAVQSRDGVRRVKSPVFRIPVAWYRPPVVPWADIVLLTRRVGTDPVGASVGMLFKRRGLLPNEILGRARVHVPVSEFAVWAGYALNQGGVVWYSDARHRVLPPTWVARYGRPLLSGGTIQLARGLQSSQIIDAIAQLAVP